MAPGSNGGHQEVLSLPEEPSGEVGEAGARSACDTAPTWDQAILFGGLGISQSLSRW